MTHPTHYVNGYILYVDTYTTGLHCPAMEECNIGKITVRADTAVFHCCVTYSADAAFFIHSFNSEIMVISKLPRSHLIAIFLTPYTCKQSVLNALVKKTGARCSCGKSVNSSCNRLSDQSFMVDPLSYFLFQPVLHNWCNKVHGMCFLSMG